MTRVLVIEDEADLRENLAELLEGEGFAVDTAADGKLGISVALARPPDVVVCDIAMPVMDGYQVLARLRDYPVTAEVPFLFLSARADRADVQLGLRLGADDYVAKPFRGDHLLASLRALLARRAPGRAAARGAPPSPGPTALPGMIVRSDALARTWERARRAAATDLCILLLGETGVGKDVFAHAIHNASARAGQPFVPLHCAALAPNLVESELFGYDRGSFTGAAASRPGLLESAEGGTAFLDEIGEVPPDVQVKLLRVLEDRRFTRVGGRTPRQVDLRFIAATNRRLDEAVAAGSFRRDLYFRVAGVVIEIPPLRERREEIVPLAERFVAALAQRLQRAPLPALSDAAKRLLVGRAWPGNVRELRNAVEQAVALSEGPTLDAAAFEVEPHDPAEDTPTALRDEIRGLERERIVAALDRYGGNQTRAAEALGMSRRTLLNRLDAFGLPRPRRKG